MDAGMGAQISDKYRWFVVEYNPYSDSGRMPGMFATEFYDKVPNRVLLCDRYDNEIEVRVRRKNGEVHLTDGWKQIGRLYNLQEGGWLKLFYFSTTEFIVDSIQHRWMTEVNYPQPPQTYKLGVASDPIQIDANHEDGNASNAIGDNQIYYTADKKLNVNHVKSSCLILPAAFCDAALETGTTECVLVDEFGITWPCKLRWAKRASNECYLTNGWVNFAKAKGLKEGSVIRFSAAKNEGSKIYVAVV